jgi:hypothetical protein
MEPASRWLIFIIPFDIERCQAAKSAGRTPPVLGVGMIHSGSLEESLVQSSSAHQVLRRIGATAASEGAGIEFTN